MVFHPESHADLNHQGEPSPASELILLTTYIGDRQVKVSVSARRDF